MSKSLFILGIAVLLLAVGLSGCVEEDTSQNYGGNIERIILGSWKWVETITTVDGNTTSYNDTENPTILTFYDNGTMKVVYGIGGSETDWVDYKIENNKLIGSMYGLPSNSNDISISEDGKYLTVSSDGVYPDGRIMNTIGKFIRLE